jgi:hypothetical protein
VQIAAVHVRQGIADHVNGVFGTSGHEAEPGENENQQNAKADAGPFEEFLHARVPLTNNE